MIYLFTGLLTSVLHVISGPDHLAAVTPLALSGKLKSWFIGLFWGIGHVLGALIIGGLSIALRDFIPIEKISEHSEQIVGLMLIIIGAWAFFRIRKMEHDHDHVTQEFSVTKSRISAISIGIIHGLAGVSHIVGILPTLALPTKTDAIFYLTGFAGGTIVAMILYSFILGYLSYKTVIHQKQNLYKIINVVGGTFAIVVGLYWIGLTW